MTAAAAPTTQASAIAPTIPVAFEPVGAPIGFVEFVTLIAALMSLTALGIDSMLPGLPAIGRSLHVLDANRRQFVITAFVGGFGLAQLAHGPLADRYGRRTLLLWSLSAYVVANVAAALAGSFTLLLVARVVGGASISACRVAVVALVRDCYEGRSMARVMSIAFMVFMIVPVIAPSFGSAVLLIGSWRLIFWIIAAVTLLVLIWFAARMPETLRPEDRQPISARRIIAGWRRTLADRSSLGYTLASTALLGALYGYLNSIQQVMADVFHRPALLAVIFATTAATMAAANLFNARLVMRLGTRRISHAALVGMIAASALHLVLTLSGTETLLTFGIVQAVLLGCFGLATSNFSAMAMEHMGEQAGIVSSVQGFVTVTTATLIGAVIGQAFDGTTAPLAAGFLLCAVVAMVVVAVTERGHLFRPH